MPIDTRYSLGDVIAVDALADLLPCAVLLVDADGRCDYENPAARRLPEAAREELRWLVTRALLIGEPVHDDALDWRAADGRPHRLTADVVPVRGDAGADAALVVASDATAATTLARWAPVMESLGRL
jgi:PAS domain-containing protein